MKQTKMYVCTFEEFILDDLHYLEYKLKVSMELELELELNMHWKNAGLYTLATKE